MKGRNRARRRRLAEPGGVGGDGFLTAAMNISSGSPAVAMRGALELKRRIGLTWNSAIDLSSAGRPSVSKISCA